MTYDLLFVDEIALRFFEQLDLTPAQLARVRRDNVANIGTGICATHDVCDANMPMEAAFEIVMRRMPDPESEFDAGLWSAAWRAAFTRYLVLKEKIVSFKEEFPDYPEADMPPIPDGFVDQSWHNDTCPSFVNEALGVQLYVDYADIEQRELKWPRFCLLEAGGDSDKNETLISTDNWAEVLLMIEQLKAKRVQS